MEFFGKFLEGIRSAGVWALNNSSDMAGVVDTVARNAGSIASSESPTVGFKSDDDDGSSNVEDYHQNFKLVSTYLLQTAKAEAQKLNNSNTVQPNDKTIILDDGVSGIFKNPAGLTPDGHPTHTIYTDLSKFLGQMNVPLSVSSSENKDTTDVAYELGRALFANDATAGPLDNDEDWPKTVTFNLSWPDGSGTIRSAHTYYPLPMDQSGKQNILHSAMYVEYKTSKDQYQKYRQDRALYNFTRALEDRGVWLVSLNIRWGNAVQAESLQKSFQAAFRLRNAHLEIKTSSLLGTLQLLKVQGPRREAPASIRSDVRTSVNSLFLDYPPKATIIFGNPPMNKIEVEVTHSFFIV